MWEADAHAEGHGILWLGGVGDVGSEGGRKEMSEAHLTWIGTRKMLADSDVRVFGSWGGLVELYSW